ncbi:DNA polymerase III subunit beta [Methylobacterium sp. Leaf466]|nr:DNA polymerase III subunit beta [Methylobacterium sp. Leaf108]KQT80612.1 DNA polymerase III subunit beta [Methylobacterium sp. Leaf466]
MDRETAIAILRKHEGELRRRGVRHAALFGSTARGEASMSSDVDVMVALDRETVRDLYDYVGVVHFISDLFPIAVDVANRDVLKASIRDKVEQDAIHAF